MQERNTRIHKMRSRKLFPGLHRRGEVARLKRALKGDKEFSGNSNVNNLKQPLISDPIKDAKARVSYNLDHTRVLAKHLGYKDHWELDHFAADDQNSFLHCVLLDSEYYRRPTVYADLSRRGRQTCYSPDILELLFRISTKEGGKVVLVKRRKAYVTCYALLAVRKLLPEDYTLEELRSVCEKVSQHLTPSKDLTLHDPIGKITKDDHDWFRGRIRVYNSTLSKDRDISACHLSNCQSADIWSDFLDTSPISYFLLKGERTTRTVNDEQLDASNDIGPLPAAIYYFSLANRDKFYIRELFGNEDGTEARDVQELDSRFSEEPTGFLMNRDLFVSPDDSIWTDFESFARTMTSKAKDAEKGGIQFE